MFGVYVRDHKRIEPEFLAALKLSLSTYGGGSQSVDVTLLAGVPGEAWVWEDPFVFGKPLPELEEDALAFGEAMGLKVEIFYISSVVKVARFLPKEQA